MNILVVDDNRSSASAMSLILANQGHNVTTSYNGQDGIAYLNEKPFDLIFTDLKMEPVNGMQVLRAARLRPNPIEVIVFTAFGAVEHAVEAMQLGARDFLTKPISVEQILARVSELEDPTEIKTPVATRVQAASDASRRLYQLLQAVSDVPSPIWLEGELGSGRTYTANWIHQHSSPDSPFHVIDPHELDSFPSRGVCVLPGVDELTEQSQRALVHRLKNLPPEVRVISTARPGSHARVEKGKLRADLYFELAVVIVPIPPLRERHEDILPLFEQSLADYCQRYNRMAPILTPEQRRILQNYSWPGNMKELRNLAERTAVLGLDGFTIQAATAPHASPPILRPGFRLADYLEEVEKSVLVEALHQANGDRTIAGRILGVERNTLRYKLNKYELLQ